MRKSSITQAVTESYQGIMIFRNTGFFFKPISRKLSSPVELFFNPAIRVNKNLCDDLEKIKTRQNHLCIGFAIFFFAVVIHGCIMTPKDYNVSTIPNSYPEGTIISGQTGMPVSFESLLQDLSDTRIVYIGESHTRADHHEIQLKLIQSLVKKDPEWAVGMEMFDYTYQNILDQWSDGKLDEKRFLEKSHWYANWRYDFELYRNLLLYIRESRLRLFGLNIPFHLPPKIAIGGIESLSPDEKKHLPIKIDTTNPDHRTYVSDIFKGHQIKGRNDFEYFYLAQCVWEDAMAERIASGLEGKKMIVLTGNGHILRKFGIPDRTFSRTRTPFRTIYLTSKEGATDLSYGDYIWITP